MSRRTVWNMQDDFHAASTDGERTALRQEMRDAGFSGVAATIGKPEDQQNVPPSPGRW